MQYNIQYLLNYLQCYENYDIDIETWYDFFEGASFFQFFPIDYFGLSRKDMVQY